jgi:hypothetical protein
MRKLSRHKSREPIIDPGSQERHELKFESQFFNAQSETPGRYRRGLGKRFRAQDPRGRQGKKT